MSKIKQDIVNELHKPARKNFKRRRVIIKGLDDLWQSDLMEFQAYAKENKGHKFVLVVIDCFSKFVWTQPLKSKTGVEVRNAMEIILKGSRQPKNLQTDAGKEFYNIHFSKLMNSNQINHYSTYSTKKASIAERVIRTIKDKLYREFSLNGKYKWIDILPTVTAKYNDTIHSTIKMRPRNVNRKNEKQLLKTVYNHLKISGTQRFHIGDIVRISKYKSLFDKGYSPNWSTELFKIIKVKITNPTTYLLEDMNGQPILGGFYEYELQKAKHSDVYLVEKILRKRGNNVYVKWLGLNQNTWVPSKDIL